MFTFFFTIHNFVIIYSFFNSSFSLNSYDPRFLVFLVQLLLIHKLGVFVSIVLCCFINKHISLHFNQHMTCLSHLCSHSHSFIVFSDHSRMGIYELEVGNSTSSFFFFFLLNNSIFNQLLICVCYRPTYKQMRSEYFHLTILYTTSSLSLQNIISRNFLNEKWIYIKINKMRNKVSSKIFHGNSNICWFFTIKR